jgi:sugar/nucleoside kinase (ribokinase family)
MAWPPPLKPKHSAAPDVVVFGENSLDFVGIGPRPAEGADKTALQAFDLYVGGQAATAAVACARQGLRTRYVGSFGADDPGATVRAALARDDVDVVAVERPGAKSRVAMVLVDSGTGNRTVFGFRDPALAIDPASLPADALVSGRVLMLDATDLSTAMIATRLARDARVPTVIDVDHEARGVDDLLAEIDVLIVSESFLSEWQPGARIGGALRKLAAEYQPAAAIVTLGDQGSLAVAGDREIRTPAFRVQVADTTGAGDAFRGGFVSAWIRMADKPDLRLILELANATAALNCCAVGAQTGLPRLAEVEALVTVPGRARSK